MGKIHTTFNYSLLATITGSRAMGVTPKDIMDAFGQLPGHTTIESIVHLATISLTNQYRIEAENDTLPDGTEIMVKYRRDTYVDSQGAIQSFERFDGIDIQYPAATGQYVNPPILNNGQPVVPSPSAWASGRNMGQIPGNTPLTHKNLSGFVSTPKCNCGSAAVGSPQHSNWCDANDRFTDIKV